MAHTHSVKRHKKNDVDRTPVCTDTSACVRLAKLREDQVCPHRFSHQASHRRTQQRQQGGQEKYFFFLLHLGFIDDTCLRFSNPLLTFFSPFGCVIKKKKEKESTPHSVSTSAALPQKNKDIDKKKIRQTTMLTKQESAQPLHDATKRGRETNEKRRADCFLTMRHTQQTLLYTKAATTSPSFPP